MVKSLSCFTRKLIWFKKNAYRSVEVLSEFWKQEKVRSKSLYKKLRSKNEDCLKSFDQSSCLFGRKELTCDRLSIWAHSLAMCLPTEAAKCSHAGFVNADSTASCGLLRVVFAKWTVSVNLFTVFKRGFNFRPMFRFSRPRSTKSSGSHRRVRVSKFNRRSFRSAVREAVSAFQKRGSLPIRRSVSV